MRLALRISEFASALVVDITRDDDVGDAVNQDQNEIKEKF